MKKWINKLAGLVKVFIKSDHKSLEMSVIPISVKHGNSMKNRYFTTIDK